MKLTKAERKQRRRRIMGGVGKFVLGTAVDLIPGGGAAVKTGAKTILKAVPALNENKNGIVKKVSEMDLSVDSDLIPLGRTAGKLTEFFDIVTRLYSIALEIVEAWDDIKALLPEKEEEDGENKEA